MLLSGLVMTGALGVGIKVYRDKKRKKEYPWTVYAERLGIKKGQTKRRLERTILLSIHNKSVVVQKTLQDKIEPLFGGTRGEAGTLPSEQLQNLSSGANDEQSHEIQKRLNRNLVIASASLGLACMGALLYPPLSVLSWPGFFVITRYTVVDSYNFFVKKRQIGIDAVSVCVRSLLFFTGYYVLANLSCFIYTFNRKLLSKVKDSSKTNIIDVFKQRPRSVFLLSGGVEIEVPFEKLKVGDTVIVNTGEMIPVDGTITDGFASIDQHILTGESQPAEKTIGDQAFASTVVLSGRVCIRVEKTGEETTVAQIGEILNQTVDFKTDLQLWAERMTDKTVLPTLLVGACLLPMSGVIPATAFLYSHPLYKPTIAGSVAVLSSLNLASEKGILIKDGRTLELLNQVDTVVFDKTGTLTKEQPHVAVIHTSHGVEQLEVLRLAAAAEYKQSHAERIAKAILEEASSYQLELPDIYEAEYKVGYGISVTLNDQVVRVGSVRFMEMEEVTIAAEMRQIEARCHPHQLVLVGLSNQVIGGIELHASVRPEAKAVIGGLRERKIKKLYIISGDHEGPTKKLAQELGIDHYFAETLPEQKADLIDQLHREGKSVCYVGDGINDSIALKKAKVSVSLRGASSVATDTAQVVLMDESLSQLCSLFDLAKQFDTNMSQTFAIVFVPHALILAGSLFLHFDFLSVFFLTQASLYSALANAVTPLIKDRMEQQSVISNQ